MKLLELFSGTGSVGKVAKSYGFEVVSLDLKNADINCDSLHWDYTVYEPCYFDFIHASPPCTEYSIALTSRKRNIPKANEIVLKCLEIIDYFKPTYYTLENPQTGYLKSQSFMNTLSYNDVDYCKYGMPYRKRTRIWNNLPNWTPIPLCKKDCNSMVGNRHMCVAQKGPDTNNDTNRFKQSELYVIPEALVIEIINSIIT